jgi:hypothetical protein
MMELLFGIPNHAHTEKKKMETPGNTKPTLIHPLKEL